MEYMDDMQLRVILFDEIFPAWEGVGGQVGVDSNGEFMVSAGVLTEIMESIVKSSKVGGHDFSGGATWAVDIISKSMMAAHDKVMPVTVERLFNE